MDIIVLIGLGVAGAVGFFVGRQFSPDSQQKQTLEAELKSKTAELEAFRSKVNTHFEKTAELFNHVSDSYQSLYDHMATSSNQLCASQTFQSLPKNSEQQNKSIADAATQYSESSPSTSTKTQSKDEELFDAEHLYKAHEYRNEDQAESENVDAVEENKVVDLASIKEESASNDAQALDYAIKKEGVVNHNSLDIENVKNS